MYDTKICKYIKLLIFTKEYKITFFFPELITGQVEEAQRGKTEGKGKRGEGKYSRAEDDAGVKTDK